MAHESPHEEIIRADFLVIVFSSSIKERGMFCHNVCKTRFQSVMHGMWSDVEETRREKWCNRFCVGGNDRMSGVVKNVVIVAELLVVFRECGEEYDDGGGEVW